MREFIDHRNYAMSVRSITIVNEWEQNLPGYAKLTHFSPAREGIFLPVHAALVNVLENTSTACLRLLSVEITHPLLDAIAMQKSIQILSIEHCIAWLWRRPHRITLLSNILHLSLGFSSDMPMSGSGFGQSMWSVIGYCISLRYLHIFKVKENGYPVSFPDVSTLEQTPNIHRLFALHIDGSEPHIRGLIQWILIGAAAYPKLLGSIRCFKLHLTGGISSSDALEITNILSIHHPSIQAFVLSGVRYLQPSLLSRICMVFPHLIGLCIHQLRGLLTRRNSSGRCSWDYSISEYARALSGSNLQHFESNFPWTSPTYSPRALDRLLVVQMASKTACETRDLNTSLLLMKTKP